MSGRAPSPWRLAAAGVRAHPVGVAGTALVLVLAGALLGATGILLESGLRAGSDDPVAGGGLVAALAGSFGGTACGLVVVVLAVTVSLALRGRRRELALLRTIGATRAQVRGLVARETAVVGLVATPVGVAGGLLAAPALSRLVVRAGLAPEGFAVTVSPLPAVVATALVLGVALVAGALGTREALRVSPQAAVGASAAERTDLGPGRRVGALVLGVAGLVVALAPVVVPGTVGSAAAASSVLLLVGAVALGGPVLVGAVFGARSGARRAAGTRGSGAGRWLALAASRGFARRLTMVVVPLALVVAIGTAQTSSDLAVGRAATAQLSAGLRADVVATVPPGAPAERVAQVPRLPGVRTSALSLVTTVAVRTDDDADLGGLTWETTSLRAYAPAAFRGLVDPDVTSGSLDALAEPGTVAVSADAVLDGGTGVGDAVAVRFAGGGEASLRVVAVYDRGLGFGGYLTSEATMRAHDPAPGVDAVLVRADDGRAAAVTHELRDLGLTAATPAGYAAAQAHAAGGAQRLSEGLLLALLAFVVVAALDALVLVTFQRRDEVVLLRRTGATRRQLVAASCWEALFVAGAAGVVGTLAAVPTVLGVGYGLLGTLVPTVQWRVYGALLAVSLVVAFVGTVPTTLHHARGREVR